MLGQFLCNGLLASCLIVPAALGLLTVYRASRFIFFAYGAVFAIPPYVAWAILRTETVPFLGATTFGPFATISLLTLIL